jgi:nucleoid DNA-binding protein
MAVKKKVSKKKVASKKRVSVKKKAVTKKVASKKKVAAKVTTKKLTAISNKMTQSQIFDHIAGETELSKAQVSAVFDSLGDLIHRSLKPRSLGQFTIPKIGVKVKTKEIPAKPKRKVRNPFTGEEQWKAASKKSRSARAVALKSLKDKAL